MKQRYIRLDGELTDDTVLVVRGGVLNRVLLEDDARRAHSVYGTYSVSVFAADGVTVDELVQEPPLVRFESFTLISVGTIKAAGLVLRPTGRQPLTPQHRVRRSRRRCQQVAALRPPHDGQPVS